MWFMPSIVNFNEQVIPNITSTNFLGRGEPVYTYANTERKLDINFWMVVDHAKDFLDINSFEDFQNRIYQKSKGEYQSNKSKKIIENQDLALKIENALKIEKESLTNKNVEFNFSGFPIDLYYPNNVTDVLIQYESYNINFENSLDNLFKNINELINTDNNKTFEITIKSTVNDSILASEIIYNNRLSKFKEYINNYIISKYPNIIKFISIIFEETNISSLKVIDINIENPNSEDSIKKRKSSIVSVIENQSGNIINFTDNGYDDVINSINEELTNNNLDQQTVTGSRLIELSDVYDMNIKSSTFNKIKTKTIQNGIATYTPEDLYKRLTFLHQCTRQGRTQLSGNKISNSVFGRPPVIVFKLGDIYNTKAIITSMTIDFSEENIPWDLNPEGFGVQKMGCKISLNMNLIGGSSVDGPKSHILNADSRRYYANSSYEAIDSGNSADTLDNEEKI